MTFLLIIIGVMLIAYVVFAQLCTRRRNHVRKVADANEYIAGVENERSRIGMELHDGIANDLLALEIKISSLPNKDYAWVATEIASVRNSVRNISHELIPPEFARLGLDDVLKYYINNLSSQSSTKITLSTDNSLGVGAVNETSALTVFRIVQELLSNILKHSGASSVNIHIESLTPKVSTISISDDGVQWPHDFDGLGLGIKTVADRTMSIGAKIEYKRFTNQNIKRITFEK